MSNYYSDWYSCYFDWVRFVNDIVEVEENQLERTDPAKISIEWENLMIDTEHALLLDAVSNKSIRWGSVVKLDEQFVASVAVHTDTVVFDRSGRSQMDWWVEWRPWLNYSTGGDWITREYVDFLWITIAIDWSSSFSGWSSLDFVESKILRIPNVNDNDDWEESHLDSTNRSENIGFGSVARWSWARDHFHWTLFPSRSTDIDWRTSPTDRCFSRSANVARVAEDSIPTI